MVPVKQHNDNVVFFEKALKLALLKRSERGKLVQFLIKRSRRSLKQGGQLVFNLRLDPYLIVVAKVRTAIGQTSYVVDIFEVQVAPEST